MSNSGKWITEVLVKNNTDVVVGIGAANRDVDIWGHDAEEWKPERWLGKTPDEVSNERLPGVYSGMSVVASSPSIRSQTDVTTFSVG